MKLAELTALANKAAAIMRAPRDADWREQVEAVRIEIKKLGQLR